MKMKSKKVPMRKCIACNENKEKKDLLRIVYNKEDGVRFDSTGKLNGRGAYVCKSEECILKLKKTNKLAHALKTEVKNNIYDDILEHISNNS